MRKTVDATASGGGEVVESARHEYVRRYEAPGELGPPWRWSFKERPFEGIRRDGVHLAWPAEAEEGAKTGGLHDEHTRTNISPAATPTPSSSQAFHV